MPLRCQPEPYVTGLCFAEGLRYRKGALWFSDFYQRCIYRAAGPEALETVADFPDRPSGLGWLPGGDLLVVAMLERRLYRVRDGKAEPFADLSRWSPSESNDMLVDPAGRAYVSHFGGHVKADRAADGRFRLLTEPVPARLILVTPDGVVRHASETPLLFPNGIALSEDGRTLMVAETVARRIRAFDVLEDGTLVNARIFAEVDGFPDGLAIDGEGGLWFADTERNGCFRVLDGGQETHAIETGEMCFSCALGGPDGRDLFMAVGERTTAEELMARRPGKILRARVDVPAASGRNP